MLEHRQEGLGVDGSDVAHSAIYYDLVTGVKAWTRCILWRMVHVLLLVTISSAYERRKKRYTHPDIDLLASAPGATRREESLI